MGNTSVTATYSYGGKEYTATSNVTVTNDFAGVTEYSILLPAKATANERDAANALKQAFGLVGAIISIVEETGSETTADKYISIGETALAKANVSLNLTKDTASQVKTV